jgi:hypothetical protein
MAAEKWVSVFDPVITFSLFFRRAVAVLILSLLMDCPICFESTSGLVAGPCGHGVCVKCTDPLFFMQGRARSTTTAPEFIPTLGKCPLCRQLLRYGDLKHVFDDDKDESRTQPHHDNNTVAFPSDPMDERVRDAVYAGPMGVGWASIHMFEPVATTEEEEEGEHHPNESATTTCSYILKDDSRLVLTDPQFHRATQTISFRLLGRRHHNDDGATAATTTAREDEGLAVFSFSDNYSFIARGLLLLPCEIHPSCVDGIWQRRRIDSNDDNDGNGMLLLLFNRQCVVQQDDTAGDCLGSFRVEETDDVDDLSSMRVIFTLLPEAVLAHPEFLGRPITTGGGTSGGGVVYDRENVWIARVQMTTTTATGAAVQPRPQNRRTSPPLPLGTCLRWQRSFGGERVHEEWILVDNTAVVLGNNGGSSSSSENTVPVPISGRDGQLYWRLDAPGPAIPIYHPNTLAENVFCQNGRIGLASYHFVMAEPTTSVAPDAGMMAAYISYEHSLAATKWPPLDNGRPIPSRMYFTNVEIMITTTKPDPVVLFLGTIDWMGTCGTTWNGATRWTYDIRFDCKFQCVVGGAVRSFEPDDIDEDNAMIMSEFGTDLVYINAAVYSGNDTTRHQFRDNMDHIRSSNDASTATVAALERALRRPAQPPSFLS